MSEEKKKKQVSAEGSFQVRVNPVEYEAKGLFLKNLLNPDFVKRLTEGIGDFEVVNISFYATKQGDLVTLWHGKSEDAKEGSATITVKQEGLKNALFKALGVEN